MGTFDARLDARFFWALVLVPPLVYWVVVEGIVNQGLGGHVQLSGLLGLVALAYGLPLAGLLWTICSVAAYTVEPGRLTVHRAVFDRVISLRSATLCAQEADGTLRLRLPDQTLRLRVRLPEQCRAALERASGAAADVSAA